MKIKAILFDLDGVLIDSPDAIWKAHNLAAKKLGYPTCKREEIYRLIGMKWDDLIAVLIPEADIELFKKTVNEMNKKVYKYVKLLGNAKKTLKELKKRGFKLALVSGSNKSYADEVLNKLKFDFSLIDVRVHAEDTEKHKPDPDPILFALKKLKVKPQEAIYVGDSLLDYRAAKAAGVNFIGVLSGVTMIEEFLRNNVIYVIKDISELLKHLDHGELMFIRKSVAAIVKYDGRILLLKRSDKVATYKNQWAVIHGRIEDGESVEKRAELEVKEETGLKVKFLKKGKMIVFDDRTLGISWHITPVLFEAKDYKVKLNWENTDYIWVKPEEMKKYNDYLKLFEKFVVN
ncbi:MAG: HAD-IA family hydrolase [Candidatus Aenigmarchaeota archaeon]|nr:HAD-IA family hydrolase [Candidatus Aenigmarchaeota archaeon]